MAAFAGTGFAPFAEKRFAPSAVRTDFSGKSKVPTRPTIALPSGRRDGDAAVWRDVYGAGGNGDGSLVGVEDRLALSRLEDSGGGAGEGSVAGVADAVRGLDGEEPLALQGEVEGIAGGLEFSLSEVEAIAAEDPEAVDGLSDLRCGFGILIEAPGENAAEVVALGAEACGSGVGEVVGCGVERLSARQESCICCVESAVHARG